MAETMSENRVSVTVYRLLLDKGYGFARLQDGQDVFLHRSAFEQTECFNTLEVGDTLTCYVTHSPKGLRAQQVRG